MQLHAKKIVNILAETNQSQNLINFLTEASKKVQKVLRFQSRKKFFKHQRFQARVEAVIFGRKLFGRQAFDQHSLKNKLVDQILCRPNVCRSDVFAKKM